MSDLDAIRLAGLQPQAPARAADASPVAVGTVLEVDAAGAAVRVSVNASEGTWVLAVAARYVVGGGCVVLRDPLTGRSVAVVGAVGPVPPQRLASLMSVDEVANQAVIEWGSGSVTVPFLPSTYTPGAQVWVSLDAWGAPHLVVGPSDEDPPAPLPTATPAPTGGVTAQATTTIFPQWSGSYRTGSGWDRWNATRKEYGGRATLYQGDAFGSGPMKGLATYGDQLVNLGAVSIDKVTVRLIPVGLSGAAGPATVQGSPDGAQPPGFPASSGTTVTGSGNSADLPADIREAMRTGAVKGLALVGANYWAVAGAGTNGGMALDVTYTRPV